MEISRTEPLGIEGVPGVAKQPNRRYTTTMSAYSGCSKNKETQGLGENKEMEYRLRGDLKENIRKKLQLKN